MALSRLDTEASTCSDEDAGAPIGSAHMVVVSLVASFLDKVKFPKLSHRQYEP